MQIKRVKLASIVENDWNPNFLSDQQFQALVKQIKKGGMRQPILVRPISSKQDLSEFEEDTVKGSLEFEIIDGAHRARAAKKAGLEEVDCVVIELNDRQAKAATIAMNHIKGEMDEVSLAKLLEELKKELKSDELTDATGIEEKRISILLKLLELPEDLSTLAETPDQKEITLTFILTPKQAKIVEETLNSIDASNKTFALLHLCKKHLTESHK